MDTRNISRLLDDCIRGESSSRAYLEELLLSEKFWECIVSALSEFHMSDENNQNRLLFVFSMITRRIKIMGCPSLDVVQWICHKLLSMATSNVSYSIKASIMNCLALIVTKLSTERCPEVLNHIYNSLLVDYFLLICFLKETAETALSAENYTRQYLKEIASQVLIICNQTLHTNSNPIYDEDKVNITIKCISAWMNSELLDIQRLFTISLSNDSTPGMVFNSSLFEYVCQFISSNNVFLNESITDMLEALKAQLDIQTNDVNSCVPSELKWRMFTAIKQNIEGNVLYFESIYNVPEQIDMCLSFARILTSTIRLFLTEVCGQDEPSGLLELLLITSQHSSLKVAIVAFEVWPDVYRAISKDRRKKLSHIRAMFAPLAHAVVAHMRLRDSSENAFDDGSIGGEELTMLREQCLGPVIHFCYEELRATLVLGLVDELNQLINDDNGTDMTVNSVEVEARMFALRMFAFSLSKRALLLGATFAALSNAAKGSGSLENPVEVGEDARHSTTILHRLALTLLRSELSPQHVLRHPTVIRCISQMIGLLGSWMGKAVFRDQSDSMSWMDDLSCDESPAPKPPSLVEMAFTYLLRALTCPVALYHASSSLRSLSQHCGSKLSSPSLLEMLLSIWNQFIITDDSFVKDCEELQGLVVEEGTDVLLESKKAVMHAACLIMKTMSSDEALPWLSRLVQPVLLQLQSGLSRAKCVAGSGDGQGSLRQLNSSMSGCVDIVALFIRSVRFPPLSAQGHEGASIGREDDENAHASLLHSRFQNHPPVQLIQSCGSLFAELLNTFPTKEIAGSVAYLMTSLITFVAPNSPVSSLPSFIEFTWTQHVKLMLSINHIASADFISECIEIIGIFCETSLRSFQETSSNNSSRKQSNEDANACRLIAAVIQEMLTAIYTFTININASRAEDSFEMMEQLFTVMQRAFKFVPMTLFHMSIVIQTIQMAMKSLAQKSHPGAVRSSTMMLMELLTLQTQVANEISIAAPGCSGHERCVFLQSQLSQLEQVYFGDLLTESFVSLLGFCAEILVDNFGSLLFSLLSRGLLQNVDMSSWMAGIKQIAISRGGMHSSDEVIRIAFLACREVRSHNEDIRQVTFTQSEFLDFCGILWKVGSGQKSLEYLQTAIDARKPA